MKFEKPFEMVRLMLSGGSTHPKNHQGKFSICECWHKITKKEENWHI